MSGLTLAPLHQPARCLPAPLAPRPEQTFALRRWALRFVAFAAPAAGPPQSGSLLDALVAGLPATPPPPSASRRAGRQLRFAAGVRQAHRDHVLVSGQYELLLEDAAPYAGTSLPPLYLAVSAPLWDALTEADVAIRQAGSELRDLTAEANRLHFRTRADLGWLLWSPISFWRLGCVESFVERAQGQLTDSEATLVSLEDLPHQVAADLVTLRQALAAHEGAAAELLKLHVTGDALEQELAAARRAREVIAALPEALSDGGAASLRRSFWLVAGAARAIADNVRRLGDGQARLTGWLEAVATVTALRGELVRLTRVAAQRRDELEGIRGAPVLRELFADRQRRAARLYSTSDALDLGKLAGLTRTLERATAFFERLQRDFEQTIVTSQRVLAAARGLNGQLSNLQRLLRQGEAGSFPIAWTHTGPQVAGLGEQLARLTTLPPLETLEELAAATAELEQSQELEGELQRLNALVGETLRQREQLREHQLDQLLRHNASWATEMRSLSQEVRRYGRANWPEGLLLQLDQVADGLVRRVGAVPQPGRPLAEEGVAAAARGLASLLRDAAALDGRVAAIRAELRRLDSEALGAARKLEGVQALLDRALVALPTQPTLRKLQELVLDLQRRLRPPIKARLAELTLEATALERQSGLGCIELAERLRKAFAERLTAIERLAGSIYGRALLSQDRTLLDLSARSSVLQSVPPQPAGPRSFAEVVADIERYAGLYREARSVGEGLRAIDEAVQRSRGDVAREGQQAHDELERAAQYAGAWPPVTVSLGKAERRLRRAEELEGEMLGRATLHAYQEHARKVCDEYRQCRMEIQLQRADADQRRQQLLAMEQWIGFWLDQRWQRAAQVGVAPDVQARALQHVNKVRAELDRLRRRHGDPFNRPPPQALERELAELIEGLQREEQRVPLP